MSGAAPFSLRLSDEERALLLARAKGRPLGEYIRQQEQAAQCQQELQADKQHFERMAETSPQERPNQQRNRDGPDIGR